MLALTQAGDAAQLQPQPTLCAGQACVALRCLLRVPFAAQVWAYAKLSHYCAPLMERFAGEAQGRIDEFSQQVLLPDLKLGLAVSVPAATPESKQTVGSAHRCDRLAVVVLAPPVGGVASLQSTSLSPSSTCAA